MKYILYFFIFLIFTGCAPKKEAIENFFQTQSAVIIKKDYKKALKSMIRFKEKLDKRNPKNYDKNIQIKIYNEMKNSTNNITLKYDRTLLTYQGYLNAAFSKDVVINRNDFLVLGLYKALYDAYEVDSGHKFIAYSYSKEKLEKLYMNLQILKWKIKTAKDINGDFLFLTWQNNWQIELKHKLKQNPNITYEEIQQLYSINVMNESLFDSSNLSFEVLLTQMIDAVEDSLTYLGVDATELSLEALKTIIMFI